MTAPQTVADVQPREMRGKLRIKSLRSLPPVRSGYKRTYEQCRTCDRVFYRDYVPYSLSYPVLTLPCGHGVAEAHFSRVRTIPEDQALPLMLAYEAALRAAATSARQGETK